MNLTTGDIVFLCVNLAGFAGVFSCLGYGLYLSHREMDRMLSCLKNCYVVTSRVGFLKLGLWGRMYVLGSIVGVFAYPKMHFSSGTADLSDVESFPPSIRLKLLWFYWLSVASLGTALLSIFAAQAGFFCLIDHGIVCKKTTS